MSRLALVGVPKSAWKSLAARFVGLAAISGCAFGIGVGAHAQGQVIIVNTSTTNPIGLDRRYAQIQPTNIALPSQQLDARGHQDLLRTLSFEQGFAMRPLPRGKRGLFLTANGTMSPTGEKYVSEVTEQGLSVKPGDRVVLSNLLIERDRIVFDINKGPSKKADFLRHIQIGMGSPGMTGPMVQDDGSEATGARVTLMFAKFIPQVTPAQVKALLAPLISFDMKTPVQAYTDTLPPRLKEAILNHQVLVGMSTDMVLFSMGQPDTKSREIEGQTPFEEWIYGHAPQDVSFVRVNGNRVIRVEIAKIGQPLAIYTKDEVEGLMTTDGKPVLTEASLREEHKVELGDVHRDPNTQAPTAPPSLRAPGEKLPEDDPARREQGKQGPMKPVIFPKDTTEEPARTVQAHPADATDAKKPDSKPDSGAAPAAKPDATSPAVTKPDVPAVGPSRG
jgi:hypothetical protein